MKRVAGDMPVLPVLAAIAAVVLSVGAAPAHAQEAEARQTFFRIGTGATGETHFPVGGLIANAISNPPGSRPCEDGGSCGVPGLIAVAQSTHGAVDNIFALAEGRLEGALAQADVSYWAATGAGVFAEQGPVESLRAVAMLYSDNIHIVARADAAIETVSDLAAKRVSLGRRGSGTLIDAEKILNAHGLELTDVKPQFLSSSAAADAMLGGELDAFFVVDADPVPTIVELARAMPVALVPIEGEPAEELRGSHPFLIRGKIPGGTYAGVEEDVATLSVGVMFLVRADLSKDLVYGITRALWHPSTRALLRNGHPRGRPIDLEASTESMGIPLHDGAAAYYRDSGLIR